MTFAYYPLRFSDYSEALKTSQEESIEHKDWFVYLIRNNGGGYIVDFQGVAYSDETIIMCLKEGQRL